MKISFEWKNQFESLDRFFEFDLIIIIFFRLWFESIETKADLVFQLLPAQLDFIGVALKWDRCPVRIFQ